jgi:ribosomal protein L32
MAVPKKKTSKTKKAKRRYNWILTAKKRAKKAFSLSYQTLKQLKLRYLNFSTVLNIFT